jgi:hypothetical protein
MQKEQQDPDASALWLIGALQGHCARTLAATTCCSHRVWQLLQSDVQRLLLPLLSLPVPPPLLLLLPLCHLPFPACSQASK